MFDWGSAIGKHLSCSPQDRNSPHVQKLVSEMSAEIGRPPDKSGFEGEAFVFRWFKRDDSET